MVQQDADEWIGLATRSAGGRHFAIEVNGVLAGGAGIEACDAERAGTARVGYWLGRGYWGRGIGTDALRTLSDDALSAGILRRLEATVFAQNVASARVLEKCGFKLEGTLRALYLDRHGAACDGLVFARLGDPA
jgi:[ribosomal protein S5]-alanine N-acetyltransferase